MKYLLIIFNTFIITTAFSKSKNVEPDATIVLEKVLIRLNSLKKISYQYKSIADYPADGYHSETSASAFLDFDTEAQLAGFKYQFSNNDRLSVYNGSEAFDCYKKERIIDINNSPDRDSFNSSPFLVNSPATLRISLPDIIADQSVPKILSDSTIGNKHFYVVNIILNNKVLNNLGDYAKTTIKLTFSYKVIINKKNFMPVEILQQTVGNKDTNRTLFTNINFNPASKLDLSWYSSSYNDYTIEKPKNKIEIIKVGSMAPDSHLTFFINQQPASVIDFKGKMVLMAFWIKDCGHCIEMIPNLNTINAKYKDKNFKLLAINSNDTKKMINLFVSRHSVKYDLLTSGKDIDHTYGVNAFPTMILINKDGKVIYAEEGFDQQKLEALIDQQLADQ